MAPGIRCRRGVLAAPLYATRFGQGLGTLYTADYRPGDRFAGAPGTSPFAFSWCP